MNSMSEGLSPKALKRTYNNAIDIITALMIPNTLTGPSLPALKEGWINDGRSEFYQDKHSQGNQKNEP